METIAVIPIFVNAGAAALPTIVAAAASVVMVMFKPRELIHLLGRRPVALAVSAAAIVIGLGIAIWCLTWASMAHAVPHGGVAATVRVPKRGLSRLGALHYDWAKVAQELIAQQQVRQETKVTTAGSMGRSGPAAQPVPGQLVKMLPSESGAVRWAAVRAMAQIGREEAHPAVDFMIRALPSASEVDGTAGNVPTWGYEILACTPDESINTLVPHLADDNIVMRERATVALGYMRPVASSARERVTAALAKVSSEREKRLMARSAAARRGMVPPRNQSLVGANNHSGSQTRCIAFGVPCPYQRQGVVMRVLVVEDEPDLLSVVAQSLREAGYAVDTAADGEDGLFKAQGGQYDALVLDLMLPQLDGWAVLKALRCAGNTVPVLILTARDALPDRVRGLDCGADDYLTKPFELAELFARLRAVIRRSAGKPSSIARIGDVQIDTIRKCVSKGGQPVCLTPREYALVEFLALHRGELVTRSMLYDHLFDEDDDSLSNLMDVHVSNVRKKLGKDFIVTRRGQGYLLEEGIPVQDLGKEPDTSGGRAHV